MQDFKNKILIVDDDLAWGESLKELLGRKAQFVKLATSLPEARQALSQDSFDVVLTDLVLDAPGSEGGGIELLEELRKSYPSTRAIAVSGYPRPPIELFKWGKVPFISKGNLSSEALDEAIAEARARPAVVQSAEVSSVGLAEIRQAFAQEASRLLAAKEQTLSIAGEGDFDLPKPLQGYKRDIERQLVRFPFGRNVFLMMKFRASNKEVAEYVAENLAKRGFSGVRADDVAWNITGNVYNPIAVLYCCKYGIALFDEPEEGQAYSPNVAYELGMMHQQNKVCLILKHITLPTVPFDLIKDLYVAYEKDLVLRQKIDRWLDEVAQRDADERAG
jgi:CheY-like chemotaxis protein